jgi:competence ComEA-like helix-hairpin-helix protein
MKLPNWLYLTRKERFALYFLFSSICIGELFYLTRNVWISGTPETKNTYVDRWPVDINKVDYEELVEIPGIGPVLAERIISFRKERGKIERLEELLEVKGIGHKLLREISHYLYAPSDTVSRKKR